MTDRAFVVDASVAVKWVVDEPGSEAAVAIAESGTLAAPAYMLVEAANGVRKQCAAGKITREAAITALRDLIAAPVARIPVDDELVENALELAIELGHPLQDCLYLALARRTGAAVLTTDRKFASAIRRSAADDDSVVLLGE